ncbi:SDR family NAD(P)-dependent oxidoreductase [Candidatus Woesearchaeota archaeon]|nr:SDR family NAD(P)-dependent oxidoreductase [Candidatus Woesearchaeota archaeon]
MRILVTGGCGFIGSEVVKQLAAKGHHVIVLDNLSKPESSIKQGYEFLRVDLTDKAATEKAFSGADICIHLAAKIGGIGYFHKYPATILSENNKMLSSVFEAAVKHKLKRMVYISSSMVYESATHFPSKEEDLKHIPPPVSAYGFSKLIGEWYCYSFWDEYKLPFSICRPFNAYGINEFPGNEIGYAHVIPDLVKKILSGQHPLEILGDGQQSRCFTHVSDVANGIITVALSPKAENQDFNVANPEETRMIELAEKIWRICKRKEPFQIRSVPGFTYDIKRRVPDTTKIQTVLGWKPQVSFEDGLHEVVTWLQKELHK